MPERALTIVAVIPCYRVGDGVLALLARIGEEVTSIVVVDDACPLKTGECVRTNCRDPRVQVLVHSENLGVGAAMATGYRAALDIGADIVIKLDGDGQMNPALIPALTRPIIAGNADYVKGNRFHRLAYLRAMPATRMLGNACLSLITKVSSGYWQLFDPTNGFTAIHAAVLAEIDLDRLARRYFFESDLLYHLNQLRAVITELPMPAVYGEEESNLRPARVFIPFLAGNLYNLLRRIGYSYFLRGFSIASLELLASLPLLSFGMGFGIWRWLDSTHYGEVASAGTVMLAALPLILGTQLLLSWISFDVSAEPRQPVHPMLARMRSLRIGRSA